MTTTAVERATKAIWDNVLGIGLRTAERAAVATLAAALDIEEMARALYDFDWDAPGDQPWQAASQLLRDVYLDRARALRASVLRTSS